VNYFIPSRQANAVAAAQKGKRRPQLVLKPHGRRRGASEKILRCLDKVAHATSISGATRATSFTALARTRWRNWSQTPGTSSPSPPRTGRAGVRYRNSGFNGQIMVEGVQVGATAEETTANARANREFFGEGAGCHLMPNKLVVAMGRQPPVLVGNFVEARNTNIDVANAWSSP
jgi:hypothetical protein